MEQTEARLQGFIAKFDDDHRRLIRALRAGLQARFPDCAELVHDNHKFFVIGCSPTERPSDYIGSIAASAAGVGLSFNRGADLPDPDGLLLVAGAVNRFIRMPSADMPTDAGVSRMIDSARAASPVPRLWGAGGRLIIRSVAARQRPRRRSVQPPDRGCRLGGGRLSIGQRDLIADVDDAESNHERQRVAGKTRYHAEPPPRTEAELSHWNFSVEREL